MFDALMALLKDCFEKVKFKIDSQMIKTHAKLPSMQIVNIRGMDTFSKEVSLSKLVVCLSSEKGLL